MATRFSSLLNRLGLDQKGVAAVEFALVVPLLLTLYLGSVDVSQGLMADRKLTSVAGTLGDLVAQTGESGLRRATLEDYFAASQTIMRPFSASETRMRVTLVSVDRFGVAQVVWSQARNGAVQLAQGDIMTLPAEITGIARESHIVVSDAWYDYRAVVGYLIDAPIPLAKQFFHIPRSGQRINLVS